MGSPYSLSNDINRVMVVRTFRGLEQALVRLAPYAANPYGQLHTVRLIRQVVEQQCSASCLESDEQAIWDYLDRLKVDYDSALTVIMVQVALRFIKAWRLNARVAMCLEPSYDWRGSDKFTCVIVMDLTLDKRTSS